MKSIFYLIVFFIVSLTAGCKKFLTVDTPIEKYTGETVYGSQSSAISAMNSVYMYLRGTGSDLSSRKLPINVGSLADEIQWDGGDKYYQNMYVGDADDLIWTNMYKLAIYQCNSVIEGVGNSTTLPDRIKKTLIAEAKFSRAWCYFYLVNLFGDVPLVLNTDYKVNRNIPRSTTQNVYHQIILDLKDAQADLSGQYHDSKLGVTSPDRVRPNKFAATALLARTYLYIGEWVNADKEASKIIENTNQYRLLPLNEVFLKNSQEAIWQLEPEKGFDGTNTLLGKDFLPAIGSTIYALSPFLLNAFEDNDQRKVDWVTLNNGMIVPYKYKVGGMYDQNQPQTEYEMVLRLAEQFLIRAEARAELGKLIGVGSASEDLNVIRNRAGLGNTQYTTKDDLLNAIAQERYVELFVEQGDRWLNLKRTGKLDARMSIVTPVKGGVWKPFKALLPIPFSEIRDNSALKGHQNPGYAEQ